MTGSEEGGVAEAGGAEVPGVLAAVKLAMAAAILSSLLLAVASFVFF